MLDIESLTKRKEFLLNDVNAQGNQVVFYNPDFPDASFDQLVIERIEKELTSYHIRMNQIKWERKNEGVIRLRCQIVIPPKYDRNEALRIITNISELETFEFE